MCGMSLDYLQTMALKCSLQLLLFKGDYGFLQKCWPSALQSMMLKTTLSLKKKSTIGLNFA